MWRTECGVSFSRGFSRFRALAFVFSAELLKRHSSAREAPASGRTTCWAPTMGQSYQKFLDEGQADLISGLATLCASAGAFIQVRRCCEGMHEIPRGRSCRQTEL